jgi:hypothetical protein
VLPLECLLVRRAVLAGLPHQTRRLLPGTGRTLGFSRRLHWPQPSLAEREGAFADRIDFGIGIGSCMDSFVRGGAVRLHRHLALQTRRSAKECAMRWFSVPTGVFFSNVVPLKDHSSSHYRRMGFRARRMGFPGIDRPLVTAGDPVFRWAGSPTKMEAREPDLVEAWPSVEEVRAPGLATLVQEATPVHYDG